jgi:predicted neutral ceramidase superfamily lipid hydrolase
MQAALLYLSAPVVVALLAPFALAQEIAPYPAIFLIGTIPVVFFFTLLIAVPMYLALPKTSRVNPMLMLGISFMAGALSFFLFSFAFRGSFSQVGQVVHVQDGSFTAAGWRSLLTQSVLMGALSLPGGLLFWLGARVEARSMGTAAK